MTDGAHPAGLAQPLIGRAGEIARIEAVLDGVATGTPRILTITGEPGIGKTRLLAELARRAADRDWLVLGGHGGEFERALPFGVIVGACDDHLASLDRRAIERMVGEEVGELAAIFPALYALARDGRPPSPVDERFRAHRAVSELLAALALRRPVLLALDDLHWCDEPSAELLGHLVRRPPDCPIVLALCHRTGQAPARLASALAGVPHEALELVVLTEDEAEALLDGLDPARRSALFQESGGNPFYLEQLARATTAPRAAGLDVPAAVAAAIERELAGLATEARTVIEAAAVVGDPFEPDVAAEIAETTEADALRAIDSAVARRLVQPAPVPRRFAFRHPIVRRVVYDAASAGWRLGAHARAADVLAARGAAAGERARHVEQAARRGDEHAIELLRAAGDALAARAPGAAARWFGAALRLLPSGDEHSARRTELLASLAHALAATGRLDESRATVLELLDALPTEALAVRVAATAGCASLEHLLGHHAEAHARLRAALDDLPHDRSPEAVKLMIELGVDAFYACCSTRPVREFRAMGDWAVRARARAEALPNPALTAAATGLMSFASAMAGAGDAALRDCNDAAAQMSRLGDDELEERIDGLAYLGWAQYLVGRYHESLATFDRGVAVSHATADGRFLLQLREGQASNLAALGRVAEALATSEAAVESARLSDTRQALAWSLGSVCLWATVAGDVELARTAGEEGLELAHGLAFNALAILTASDLATCLVEAGKPERAIELVVTAAGGRDLPREPTAWLPSHCELLAHAYVDAGRQRDAELAAARAGEAADRLGWSVARMQADRARAVALAGAGDWTAAAAAALASAVVADGLGARLDEGRARQLAGRALAAAGETGRAKQELRRAERILHECGALRWRAQTVRELRTLGVRVEPARGRRAGDRGLASLTAREREIAELVWDRRTNAEIAAELFLSKKTIETHLRNIFHKLGASSRVEVARAIERARSGGLG